MSTVSVVALGKIGLPLAVAIAGSGHTVVGADADAGVVDLVNEGTAPFPNETDLEDRLNKVVRAGSLTATTDTSDAAHGEARALAVQRFRIIVHYGRAGPGDPIPASDAANARFFEVADIEQLAVTPGLAAFVIEAGLRLDAMGEYRPMPRR